jgi:[histone H3]-lysine36 N-dimethyltransferase SETMAR
MNRIQTMKRHNGQLVLVLRDARGIIFIDYLKKGQSINRKYCMALLERLNDEIKKKTAPFEKNKVLFHQENALCHISIKTTAILHELGYELLPHLPYFPNLASSDLFLFAELKKNVCWKKI